MNNKNWRLHVLQVSDKMDPNELVKLIEILNPRNKAGGDNNNHKNGS
jgi:3-deoxy-D-arabino-heptulosonate 7-phosphate (DAHP) synthase class II